MKMDLRCAGRWCDDTEHPTTKVRFTNGVAFCSLCWEDENPIYDGPTEEDDRSAAVSDLIQMYSEEY